MTRFPFLRRRRRAELQVKDPDVETTVTTKHLAGRIAADHDADGRLAGIENLSADLASAGVRAFAADVDRGVQAPDVRAAPSGAGDKRAQPRSPENPAFAGSPQDGITIPYEIRTSPAEVADGGGKPSTALAAFLYA